MKTNRLKLWASAVTVAASILFTQHLQANGMDKPMPNLGGTFPWGNESREIINQQTPIDTLQYEVLSGKPWVKIYGTIGRRVIVRLHELDPGGNVNISLGRQLAAKEVVLQGNPYKAKQIRFKVPVGTGVRYGITVAPKGGLRTDVRVIDGCNGQMICYGYPWQLFGLPKSPYYRPYTLPAGLSRKLPVVTVEED